jgi:hypothetical protein
MLLQYPVDQSRPYAQSIYTNCSLQLANSQANDGFLGLPTRYSCIVALVGQTFRYLFRQLVGKERRFWKMATNTYTILRPAVPSERCYLSEVLLWRAFGRFPEEQFSADGEVEWRFWDEVREDYSAPIPEGFVLTQDETRYAGIPDDPDMIARLCGISFLEPESYQMLIDMAGGNSQKVAHYKLEHELAKHHSVKMDEWMSFYSDYVDEYQNEICLKLQKGELRAFGTFLPHPNRKNTGKILEKKRDMARWP